MGFPTVTCYVCSILLGLSLSSIYPLIFTFPIEGGLTIDNNQATNIGTAGVISEGVLTMIVGLLMQYFHVNMLLFSLTFIALLLWILREVSLKFIA